LLEKILEINSLLLALGIGGLTGGIKFCHILYKKSQTNFINYRNQVEFRLSNLEENNRAILHDKIYKSCRKALEDGFISMDDLHNLTVLFTSYKNQGGNGSAEAIYKKTKDLPTKGEENEF